MAKVSVKMETSKAYSKRKGDREMADPLDKETFLSVARASGLNIEDPHIEELYAFLQKVLPSFRTIDQLDLTDVEPLATFIPGDPEEGRSKER